MNHNLPPRPDPPSGVASKNLKRKRNAEDESLEKLMYKRERQYLAQHSEPQYSGFDPAWSMMDPTAVGPMMFGHPMHTGFYPNPMPMQMPHQLSMPSMGFDPVYGSFDAPPPFGLPTPPAPSHPKYTLGTPGTSIGGHSLGDHTAFQQDVDYEWGFNSDQDHDFPTKPAPGKSKHKKRRRNKKLRDLNVVEQSSASAVLAIPCDSEAEVSEAEEGEIRKHDESNSASSISPPPSSTAAASSSISFSSWLPDDSSIQHSPSPIPDQEELVEVARGRVKVFLTELKEVMNRLDGAKTKEEKMKLLVLVKAKDGELRTAQEALKTAESELEALKLMNRAVSIDRMPAYNNDFKTAQGRNSWNTNWNSRPIPRHLRFLRISSPPTLVIELEEDDWGIC